MLDLVVNQNQIKTCKVCLLCVDSLHCAGKRCSYLEGILFLVSAEDLSVVVWISMIFIDFHSISMISVDTY